MGSKQLDIFKHGVPAEIQKRRVTLLNELKPLLSRSQDQLLWLIHGFTKEKNTANGTYDWICKRTRYGRTTVYKAIKSLREANLITTWEVRRGLLVKENEYAINWEAISEAVMSGQLQKPVQNELEFCEVQDKPAVGTSVALSSKSELSWVQKVNSAEFRKRTQLSSENELSSISTTLNNYPPPTTAEVPEKPRPTIIDADWGVAGLKLKVYGVIFFDKVIREARAKGMTPQDVMWLIDHAAKKVIVLDDRNQPVEQWRMPANDVLDLYDVSGLNRLYFWEPSRLVRRIRLQGDPGFQGMAEGWFCPPSDSAAYAAAQVKLAANDARNQPPVSAAAMVDPELDAERKRLKQRMEELEAEHGAMFDAMPLETLSARLKEVDQAKWLLLFGASGSTDPRTHRLNRGAALKLFASVARSARLQPSESQDLMNQVATSEVV